MKSPEHALEIANAIWNFISIYHQNDHQELKDFIVAIRSSRKVFLLGAGRSGLVSKFFGMRLMHLGIQVHLWGDCTTPRVEAEDLVIAISASGETPTVFTGMQRAAQEGATLASITQAKSSSIANICDLVIDLPKPRKETRSINSLPLGSLFELSSLLLLEGMIAEMMHDHAIHEDSLRQRHNILE
ncbi:MAG: SIS domain-containing protein [Synechococcaceae bacterium WB4_1_0192]|jgi:6-phospho 3-hexuloisomerase|nr:SIS domain-containing protein [Synechococcaceae bacterium WB4_1_0192]